MNSEFPATRPSLLARIHDIENDQAWSEFVGIYESRIRKWASRHGYSVEGADDIVQEVLLRVSSNIRKFEYDVNKGKFRSWLWRITQSAIVDSFRHFEKQIGSAIRSDPHILAANIVDDDAKKNLLEELTSDWEFEMLRIAEQRVRETAKEVHWNAYKLTDIDKISVREAAFKLGIQIATLYAFKSKIRKRIKEEFDRLNC